MDTCSVPECTGRPKVRGVYAKSPKCGDDCWPYSKLFCTPHGRIVLNDWMERPEGACPDGNHELLLRAIEPLYVR